MCKSSLLVPIFENESLKNAYLLWVLSLREGQRLWSRSADCETPPAFCFGKKRAWEKPPFLKGAAFPIQNSIREADSSFFMTPCFDHSRAGSPRWHFPPECGGAALPTIAVHAAGRLLWHICTQYCAPHTKQKRSPSPSKRIRRAQH